MSGNRAEATLTLSQVAELLGYSETHLIDERPALEAAGFPPPIWPVPDRRGARGRRWSRAAVQGWIDRQTQPQMRKDLGPVVLFDDDQAKRRAELAQRIEQAALGLA